MSSSFVKDCSDVSAPGNSSSGKTVIIIVNNETGNVSLDQDELQNLLASHGADGSQVSVVRMGSGGVGGVIGNTGDIITTPSIVASADGTAHVNFTVEGYPAIPLEGQVSGGMNYAELPLDQDAFQRLESVLDSEEAREILGEPLLNMVANPDQLGTLDQLMDSSLFESADQDSANDPESINSEGSTSPKKSRSPPKRRSQRQMDKAEREEVEKILAENKKLLQEEKQQLNEQQVLEKMQKLNTVVEEEEEEDEDEDMEEEEEEESDNAANEDEGSEKTVAKDSKKSAGVRKRGRPGKGRGRIRGKGKLEAEKEKAPPEAKGKGKGKKKIEEEEPESGVGRGRGRGRGSAKEESVGSCKGRGRGALKKEEKEGVGVGKKSEVVVDEKNVNSVGRRKKVEAVDNDGEKGKSPKGSKKADGTGEKKADEVVKGDKKSNDKDIHKESAKSGGNTKSNCNKNSSDDKKVGNQKERKDSNSESDKKLKLRKGGQGSEDDDAKHNVDNKSVGKKSENQKEKGNNNESDKRLKLRKSARGRDEVSEEGNAETKANVKDDGDAKRSRTSTEVKDGETENEKKGRLRKGLRGKDDSSDGLNSKSDFSAKKLETQEEEKENVESDKQTRIRKGLRGKEEGGEEAKSTDQETNADRPNAGGRRKIVVRTTKKSDREETTGKIGSEESAVVRTEATSGEIQDEKMETEVNNKCNIEELVADFNSGSSGLQIKPLKVAVEKINVEEALEREIFNNIEMDSCSDIPWPSSDLGKAVKDGKSDETSFKSIADLNAEIFGDSEEPERDGDSKECKVVPATPKVISNFHPPLSSTPITTSTHGLGGPSQTLILKGGKNGKGQKIVLTKKNNPKREIDSGIVQGDKNSQVDGVIVSEAKSLEKPGVVVVKTKVQKDSNPLLVATTKTVEELEANAKMSPEKIAVGEGRSKLIQVKSPMGIRQVVVLNSVKSAPNKETLVKVIDPIDPPREEERLSVAKICANAKKEAALKKKLDLQKKKNLDADEANDIEEIECKDKHEIIGPQSKAVKVKGKVENKASKVEVQKKEAPKIVDLEMKLEDSVQLKKREAQRKREEIQRKREEILRKREAIKLRKEQQMKESMQMKKVENHEHTEQENKVERSIQKSKTSVVVKNSNAEVLRRSVSQESPTKREVKVIVQSNKGQGLQRADSVEFLSKVKGQTPNPKTLSSEMPQKNKVKVTVTKNQVMKNQVTAKKVAIKEPEVVSNRKNSNTKKVVEAPKPIPTPEESPVRRSGRAIKKKTFGDEMVTFDLKEEIAPEVEEEPVSEEEVESDVEEDEDSVEDYDDPERLWCICQKPHNNRFMICCDRCEDWFHGTCVGITKAIGQQMEDGGQEWVCPKCKKAEKAMKSTSVSTSQKKEPLPIVTTASTLQSMTPKSKVEAKSSALVARTEAKKESSTLVTRTEAKKIISDVSKKEAQTITQVPNKKIAVVGKKVEVSSLSPPAVGRAAKVDDANEVVEVPSSSSSSPSKGSLEDENKDLEEHQIPGTSVAALKSEPRVLVYEKITGKILSGSEAPSLREVKSWLKDHPNYAVLHPGMMRASGAVVKTVKTDGSVPVTDALWQKKVIQLSAPPALSAIKATPQKLTVVKSADGRIIVKASEALSKGFVNKIVSTTTTTTTVAAIATKTGVVSSSSSSSSNVKPVVVSAKAFVKDAEMKGNESDGLGLDTISEEEDFDDTDFSDSDELPDLVQTSRKSAEFSPVKKSIESSPVKKSIESNPLKKNTESSPVRKSVESNPVKKSAETSPVKKSLENSPVKLIESPTKNIEAPSFKNVDSVAAKNAAETLPTKLPDASKVTSVKDVKKTPLKPPAVEKKASDPSIVRSNVRKTLAECLLKRSKEAINEFEDMTEDDISDLAEDIEKELYLFFSKDVGFKYKSRYRSLLFNIRDTKNSGLFRKILNGTISPSNLAKMTSEELASKELAEWRVREEKKELQAIEKYELDMISLGNQYIMKSHKGEIEIDKDEFIKDKEKAPETINALPTDPVIGVLEDTSASHKNHMYDLNCKICTGQQDSSTVPQDAKYKGKHQDKKDGKDDKRSDALKVKDRKDRKSSSDRDKDKERHRHKSKDHDRDKSKKHKRERSKEKDKDERSKSKEAVKDKKDVSEKEKYRDKHRDRKDSEREKDRKDSEKERDKKDSEKERDKKDSERDRDRKDSERERHKSSDKKERRDSKDDKDRKHKHKKDRRSSKDDRERRRKDSEGKERKRKHSESRSDDRKRRESEKSRIKDLDGIETELDSDKLEREKVVVSTSEDVVVDLQRSRRESFSQLDADAKDSVPTSTVIGSPDIIELKDDGYPSSYDNRRGESPTMYSGSPNQPSIPRDYCEYIPPLPGDEAPLPPPLPDSPPAPPVIDIPCTPPLPDSPCTPPLPDSLLESPKTPSLPDEICLSPSTADDDDFPNTPPLPDDDDDDIPATPPLPSDMDASLLFKDRPSTPPLPFSKSGLASSLPSSSTDDRDRMTPPLESVLNAGGGSSPVPLKTAEPVIVWKGVIHMTDVSKFCASAFEVSGKARFLPDDVPKLVEVVGRISPDTVWSYIAQTKKTGNKEILVVRFQPSNEEEKVSYIALYSYLSSKKRYGVIGNCEKAVKDFYIVPLASHQPIPQVLLPLDGPGFEEHRAHMLIGVIIRAKHRRIYDHITGTWQIIGGVPNAQPNPIHKGSELLERSYTPPLPTDQDIEEIAVNSADSSEDDAKFKDRSTTPPPKKRDRDEDSSEFCPPGSLKRQAKGQSDFDQPKKRANLDRRIQEVAEPLRGKESKSSVDSGIADGSLDQESMLAELNRQIEVHKKELSEMQKTVLNEEEEPYSPSMSNSASPGEEPMKLDTSKISIPSNLQEILNNIKEKELEIKNKEQEIKRRLNLAADPIVMNYAKMQDTERKSSSGGDKVPPPSDVDLRPVLQVKPKEVEHKEDVDLRILQGRDPKEQPASSDVFGKSDDTDLRVRDPRLARAHAAAVMEAIEKGKTLGTLTDEELLAKALEMEGCENSNRQTHLNPEVEPMFQPVPPPPFMTAGPSGYMPQPGPMGPPNTMPCPQPPGMVGMPFMNQVGQPSQPIGMYGPPGARDQGARGPSSMPGPPNVHEPGPLGPHGIATPSTLGPPCGPPIHEGPGLPGCVPGSGPGPMEPPSRYGESSRYPDKGHWDRNYGDRDWDYNYDHYRKGERYRSSGDRYRDEDRYRDGDYYRDKDRDRDWRRRQDRDSGFQRHPFNRRKKQFDNRGSSGGGDHERKRSRSSKGDGGGDGDLDRRRNKSFENRGGNSDGGGGGGGAEGEHERKRDRFHGGKSKKKNFRQKHQNRKWDNFDNLHRENEDAEDKRGPEDEDADDCPYEIDY